MSAAADAVVPTPRPADPSFPGPSSRWRLRRRPLRLLVAVLALLAPGGVRRWLHVRLLGAEIHPTARLGRSLVDVDHLVLEEGSVIGPLNLIRGCALVHLGPEAQISALVWVNAVRQDSPAFADRNRRPALVMGRKALITTLHLLDACDTISLADYAVIAGFWTLVQTHAYDMERMAQAARPVRIGDHSLVASRCTLLPGAVVADSSVVAAGAVVTGPLKEAHLSGGVPARAVRPLDPAAPFFHRVTSHYR